MERRAHYQPGGGPHAHHGLPARNDDHAARGPGPHAGRTCRAVDTPHKGMLRLRMWRPTPLTPEGSARAYCTVPGPRSRDFLTPYRCSAVQLFKKALSPYRKGGACAPRVEQVRRRDPAVADRTGLSPAASHAVSTAVVRRAWLQPFLFPPFPSSHRCARSAM
jgi:hypothetical protein